MIYTPNIQAFLEYYEWNDSPESLIKKLVRDLLTKIGGKFTSNTQKLKMCSSYRGIKPEPHYVDLEDVDSGSIMTLEDEQQIIQLNRRHSEQRQFFTWAHEICHSFFPSQNLPGSCIVDQLEEKLCDIGAAEILFSDTDLHKYSFSASSLSSFSRDTSSSLEAAAIYMVKSGVWPNAGMAVWKQKYRKSENPDQTVLFEDFSPKAVFRAEYSIYPNGIIIPKNKSIDGGDLIKRTYQDQISGIGAIFLNLKPKVQMYMDTLPISNQRILSLIKSYRILS